MRGLSIRAVIVLICVIVAGWQISYTWRNARLALEQKAEMYPSDVKKLEQKAINLGLDLRGGMYLVLSIEKEKLKEDEIRGARDRALEIIRNRIDQFGVSEPRISRQGLDRIVIELPGVVDRERAKEIIGKTAMLEFRLVETEEKTDQVLRDIDEKLHSLELEKVEDTLEALENPLLYLIHREIYMEGGRAPGRWVPERDVEEVKQYLEREDMQDLIPADETFLFSTEEETDDGKYKELLLVKKEAVVTGDAIVNATAGIGTRDNPMEPRVNLSMSSRVRRTWAHVTGANIGRRIAIVLDDVVQSAPQVITRIPSGESIIEMGTSPFEEAQDLALIIRAGALPAPVTIIEERSVGPTLGSDSIRAGIRSLYIGGIAIFVFMVVYYAACGLIADLALCLNLLFLLAILSGFRATLTLPGMAGIVLVVGAAVDANVLIFERIREEILAGKTTRAAISAGYSRAFRTILDANVTTFLAAIILYWFGTGPIKGFAITLSIGIVASFFTAIVITRVILDYFTSKFKIKRLSI
jgi:SecD/SecF fusion protein